MIIWQLIPSHYKPVQEATRVYGFFFTWLSGCCLHLLLWWQKKEKRNKKDCLSCQHFEFSLPSYLLLSTTMSYPLPLSSANSLNLKLNISPLQCVWSQAGSDNSVISRGVVAHVYWYISFACMHIHSAGLDLHSSFNLAYSEIHNKDTANLNSYSL